MPKTASPSSSSSAGKRPFSTAHGSGAVHFGTRFASGAAAVLVLLAAAVCAWGAKPIPRTVSGNAGNLHVHAPEAHVSMSRTDGRFLWHISGYNLTLDIPAKLKPFIRPEANGYTVSLPAHQDPRMIWQKDGLIFRWQTGQGSSDVFATYSPPTYPLGPGDELKINVYGVKDMNQDVVVDPKGYVTFPLLDKVHVAGLTVNETQHKLEGLLGQYIKSPQVNVQLVEYGSRFFNVLGEVTNPGRYPIKGAFRLLDAISQAGGFTDKSGDIELQRRNAEGKLVTKIFPKNEVLAGGNSKANIYVMDEDVINVLPMKSIYVSGEVKNPGAFLYNDQMTLLRAVAMAGGFTQWAKKDKVDILRDNGKGGTETIHVDAHKIEQGKIDDVPLKPNDHIVVRQRKFF